MAVHMGLKRTRFTDRMLTADPRERYRDVHVFLGGTGAVGGTALFKTLTIYEEMMTVHPPEPDEVPILVATGKSDVEVRVFKTRLFRFVEARHDRRHLPAKVRDGFLTDSGVFIIARRFTLSALPDLDQVVAKFDPDGRARTLNELKHDDIRRDAVHAYVRTLGADPAGPVESVAEALDRAVQSARPMSRFLEQYRDTELAARPSAFRYRCVFNGIPLPSFFAYHFDPVVRHLPQLDRSHVESLKATLSDVIKQDIAHVQSDLAESVIIAHTTGVGGMYDDYFDRDGHARSRIRLGFGHSAQDESALLEKHRKAEALAREYGTIGVKVLITAAAIGIDEVRVRQTVELHSKIKDAIQAHKSLYERADATSVVPLVHPQTIALDAGASAPLTFARRRRTRGAERDDKWEDLRPSCALRSGENGIFSVANADALYRVMKVASISELGLMLATVGLFGEDPQFPWFGNSNVCYYTETDNSRQIFDFLAQPMLREAQMSGLDPLALQDLGSSKHQGELHTLGLLILLHRLKTLDVDALPPYVDISQFDARSFFLQHSRPLTLDDVANWDVERIATELRTLCLAAVPEALDALAPFRPHSHDVMFSEKLEARKKVFQLVQHAVWAVTSLGTPIVFELDGRIMLRSGPYAAPLEVAVTTTATIAEALGRQHERSATPRFETFRDFQICQSGFIDIRPHAIVCTASTLENDVTPHVTYASTDAELRSVFANMAPYSSFASCGLLAVLFRLKALYSSFQEADLQLGTLQDAQWQMPRDANGHLLLVPGIVEALRMISEGLEKTTGTEWIDGHWGYERRRAPSRRAAIPTPEKQPWTTPT